MVLKLVFEDKLKKVSLDNRTVSLEDTLEIASRLAKAKVDQIELYYVDSEGDVIKIVDSDDFEYFMSNTNEGNEAHPVIEVKIATQNSEISPLALESLKEMEQKVKLLSESIVEVKNSLVASKEVETQIESKPEIVPEPELEIFPEPEQKDEPEAQVEQEAPEEQPFVDETSPEPKREKPSIRIVHMNVVCDGCRAHPIIGRRFKCMICPNYDLCESCEAKDDHEHPMLRLSKLSSNFFLDKAQKNFASLEEERVSRFKKNSCRRSITQPNEEIPVESPKEELREKRKRDQSRKDRKANKVERKEVKSELKEIQPCHKRKFSSDEKKPNGCQEKFDEDFKRRGKRIQKLAPELDEIFQILKLLKLEAIPRFETFVYRNYRS